MSVINKFILIGVVATFVPSCERTAIEEKQYSKAVFKDVSNEVGLNSIATWKYGGPSVSDLNNDGVYDFLLTNHDKTPVQLFLSTEEGGYKEIKDVYKQVDLHGMASGDFDLDGDNDILLSVGGGNGLAPKPQRLLRNDGGSFTDITVEAGISEMGARGRAVRWIDLDDDGDLDFMQINAEKLIDENTPRNVLFENTGDGKFTYRASPVFENIDAERVLITDFNNDKKLDLIVATGYYQMSVWQGVGDFEFKDVSSEWLPEGADDYQHTLTIAHADIDNDGDLDYYLARGLLYYGLANNSISFNSTLGRLDLRDEGNKSQDGITLLASSDLTLLDFSHFPRAKRLETMPTFVGKSKKLVDTADKTSITLTQDQAMGFPDKIDETGWYIGFVGDGKWRVEWLLSDNLAWDIRASFLGVQSYIPDREPLDANIPDVLLINENGVFRDASDQLPESTKSNNWGVIVGDYNNDGLDDFFINRFGELKERVSDVLVTNLGSGRFKGTLATSATSEIGSDSHGDMGAAFDYDLDGKIDLLNGDDDNGSWHLYKNVSESSGNFALIRVGYSENGVDPMAARIYLKANSGSQYKIVGSTSANHTQSLLNTAHFGLAEDTTFDIQVEWRDGSVETRKNIEANQLVAFGRIPKE